ncbi:MAG: bifunctional methylenetetrahydrofolate dehydrogenase/methenyltetrahydrofolate cyclohydrolase FolD [Alicyclobacillus sp.]|nr:bifunctional methylenetetrahydrofolate dehydrogenase/methenyltetrahydrofolate cyclohydrolase FolD [Alicyclobacillus sp.]
MATVLDGKRVAESIHVQLRQTLQGLQAQGLTLKLAVVLVGDHPASASYVRGKQRAAARVGLDSELIHLPADVSEEALLAVVERLNADPAVDGVLVQLPLPDSLDEQRILRAVSPDKDVDGFHPYNVGLAWTGQARVWPCTPAGILALLQDYKIPLAGKHAVVVGRSRIVGKPMAALLLQENATVTVCHSQTRNLADLTRQADLLVVAAGVPRLIGLEHVRPGAVVIDVGIHRVDGQLMGDVDFSAVSAVAAAITPVPGGVGPLTVAQLLANTVHLGLRRRGLEADEGCP